MLQPRGRPLRTTRPGTRTLVAGRDAPLHGDRPNFRNGRYFPTGSACAVVAVEVNLREMTERRAPRRRQAPGYAPAVETGAVQTVIWHNVFTAWPSARPCWI